jgi:hypothetical protein
MLVTSSIATAGRTATTTSPVTPSSRCSEPMLEVMINHRMRKLTVWPWGVGDPAVVQHLEQRTRTTSSGQEHAALAAPRRILAMLKACCQSYALHQVDKLILFVNDPVREASRR